MIEIPAYKKWLSYLWEQPLETTSSGYNPQLTVSLVRGRVQLTAQNAIYSFGDYYLNFRKAFQAIDLDKLPPDADVLVLGLGLGSIPELLEALHLRKYKYVAIEIDPVIVQLAQDYSLHRLKSSIEIVNTDAQIFLEVDQRKFDLICMDVFQDAIIPNHLSTIEFLEQISQRLRPDGILIYNCLANTDAKKRSSQAFFDDSFCQVFPSASIIDTGGNYMLVSDQKFVD
ncbi:MAG: fused MFS/spermidine synthase [Bacteroidota bacterium]